MLTWSAHGRLTKGISMTENRTAFMIISGVLDNITIEDTFI